jgi:hypothetical protein
MKHLALLAVLALLAAAGGPAVSGAGSHTSARACRHPRFVTSDPNGMWSHRRYVVHNNMWNASGYDVSERLRACSPGNWSVTATADDRTGDGAVKTYPNVHRDYHDWATGHEPRLASFRTIRSTFASRSPHVGRYDGAYDIWLNGVPGRHEVMIWTDNHRQVPAGSVVRRGLHFSHRTWRLWATPDHAILSFVPNRPLRHGTIAIKKRLDYLVRHGFLPHRSTLGQVCFGYEIVSTGGAPARFKIDGFSVTSTRR